VAEARCRAAGSSATRKASWPRSWAAAGRGLTGEEERRDEAQQGESVVGERGWGRGERKGGRVHLGNTAQQRDTTSGAWLRRRRWRSGERRTGRGARAVLEASWAKKKLHDEPHRKINSGVLALGPHWAAAAAGAPRAMHGRARWVRCGWATTGCRAGDAAQSWAEVARWAGRATVGWTRSWAALHVGPGEGKMALGRAGAGWAGRMGQERRERADFLSHFSFSFSFSIISV
jgi:hypothetical protein